MKRYLLLFLLCVGGCDGGCDARKEKNKLDEVSYRLQRAQIEKQIFDLTNKPINIENAPHPRTPSN